MTSTAVMPLHDPECLLLPSLVDAIPLLLQIFDRVFLGITRFTMAACNKPLESLRLPAAIQIVSIPADLPVGDQFLTLYRRAVATSLPEDCLHLCFPDRLAFGLQPKFRAMFSADIFAAGQAQTPILFQRSPAAWDTHPGNYRELEGILTRVGELLFGRFLDFAWCHLAVRAGILGGILPMIQGHDMSILAEIVLHLMDIIETRDVDWLAWEDPYLLNQDPDLLKAEREASAEEVRKRLAYVIPMLVRLAERRGPPAASG